MANKRRTTRRLCKKEKYRINNIKGSIIGYVKDGYASLYLWIDALSFGGEVLFP
jgi:hypothetical protein